MGEPKCPHCNVVLVDADNYPDVEMEDVTNLLLCRYGECPQCKKIYSWVDVYTYSHWEDLMEVEEG